MQPDFTGKDLTVPLPFGTLGAMTYRARVMSTQSFGRRDPKGGLWKVTLTWAEVDGRAEVIGVNIRSYEQVFGDLKSGTAEAEPMHPSGFATMNAATWRALPIGQIINRARRSHKKSLERIAERTPQLMDDKRREDLKALQGERSGSRGRPRLYGPDHYAKVAEFYRTAWRAGRAPTTAVAKRWRVEPSTAAKWVKRAREEGLLGETTPGKAGEPSGSDKRRRKQ